MANPVASDDLYSVAAGSVKALARLIDLRAYGYGIWDTTLLKNDTDADGDTLSIVSVGTENSDRRSGDG